MCSVVLCLLDIHNLCWVQCQWDWDEPCNYRTLASPVTQHDALFMVTKALKLVVMKEVCTDRLEVSWLVEHRCTGYFHNYECSFFIQKVNFQNSHPTIQKSAFIFIKVVGVTSDDNPLVLVFLKEFIINYSIINFHSQCHITSEILLKQVSLITESEMGFSMDLDLANRISP